MSSEVAAADPQKHEFPCGACGADLEWKPGAERLECPYCGHSQVITQRGDRLIAEYSFEQALAQAPSRSARELMVNAKEMKCTSCGALTIVSGQAARCSFCDSPVVLHQSEDRVIVPESVLPFGLDARKAKEAFKTWVKSRWFAPSDLSRRAELAGMDGVYLPYWTYDSETETRYRGERGTWYYETESYTDAQGQRRTRQVRRTRWSPASGRVAVSFDDVLVCGSRSLPRPLLEKLEPWDLSALTPYEPAYLSGFLAERYGIDLKEGFGVAEDRMEQRIREAIAADIGGDEQRIGNMDTRHRSVKWKHFLLPLWISSFRHANKVFRFVVNARTGEAAGERPYSAIKIALAVIGGLIGAYLLFLLLNGLDGGGAGR